MVRARPPTLVVEDDDAVLDLLSDAMSDEYEVTAARNGGDGYHALCSQPFVLMVVDLAMPAMGGVELIQKVRSCADFDAVAIVVCSAADDLRSRVAGLDVQGLLPKPFTLGRLHNTLALAIELRQNQERSRELGQAAQAAIDGARKAVAETERARREARDTREARARDKDGSHGEG